VGHQSIELLEASRIDQGFHAFPGGQLAGGVLALDAFLTDRRKA
jgi:hypothetical protein